MHREAMTFAWPHIVPTVTSPSFPGGMSLTLRELLRLAKLPFEAAAIEGVPIREMLRMACKRVCVVVLVCVSVRVARDDDYSVSAKPRQICSQLPNSFLPSAAPGCRWTLMRCILRNYCRKVISSGRRPLHRLDVAREIRRQERDPRWSGILMTDRCML